MPFSPFLGGKTTEINESIIEAKPLAIASMIALQVVRTSFGFHLRECMGSCSPPPLPLGRFNNLERMFFRTHRMKLVEVGWIGYMFGKPQDCAGLGQWGATGGGGTRRNWGGKSMGDGRREGG